MSQLLPSAPGVTPAADASSTDIEVRSQSISNTPPPPLAADRTVIGWRHYSWIYKEVLERPEPIRAIITKYRLDAPDARG